MKRERKAIVAIVLLACLPLLSRQAMAGCASTMRILAGKFSLLTLIMPMKTNRALADYLDLLGPQLGAVLAKLRADDLWVDVGGGQAVAQRQYQRVIPEIYPAKARTVNLEPSRPPTQFVREWAERKFPSGTERGIIDQLTDTGEELLKYAPPGWQEAHPNSSTLEPVTPEGRARHENLWGVPLQKAPDRLFGKAALVTDSRSAMTYDRDLHRTFSLESKLLREGGSLFFDLTNVSFFDGKGNPLEPEAWFGAMRGLKLVSRYRGENKGKNFRRSFHLVRTAGPLEIPPLKEKFFTDGNPPSRGYIVDIR